MLELFAQAGKVIKNAPPTAPDPAAAAAGGTMLAGICGMYVLLLVLYGLWFISLIVQGVFGIMTLVALSKSLELTKKKYRQMEPGMVWLSLIPFFGYVWFVLTVIRAADGLVKTYKSVDAKPNPPDGAKSFGIITFCLALFLWCIPFLGPIMFFMYQKKITKLNVGLEKAIKRARDAEDDDEEEEDDEQM